MGKPLKLSLLLLAIMLLMPTTSWADVNYTFIKITCDPKSNTATIRALYVMNEVGEKKSKILEKGTYYLSDITKNRKYGISKKIKACNFGYGQTVSFTAQESREHPRANRLMLSLNNKEEGGYPLAWGQWTLEIHALGSGQFDLHKCFDEPTGIGPQCESGSISADKIVKPLSQPIQKTIGVLHD